MSVDPGQPSQPDGPGPVSLPDRTAPDGRGSPDTNQARTEPTMSPEDEPPALSSMNVGSTDAQSPSHPAAARAGEGRRTTTAPSGAVEAGQDAGGTEGVAQRTPGGQGVSPEEQETDTAAGAAAMAPGARPPLTAAPGDSQGVTVPAVTAAAGTSEADGVAQGARTPASSPTSSPGSVVGIAAPGKPDGEVDTR